MELRVSLIESVTVRPCEETKTQVIELSGLDRISPAILYTVFFFKASSTEQQFSDGNEHFERAKRALEKVLVSWFPAAGRLRINEATGKLKIVCNEKGVIMITAVTDSKLEDLGCLNEYKACYEKLVPQIPSSMEISENPLVVLQITRFACGGFAVGFGGSHSLFDGAGAFQFLASWAHISSGKDASDLIQPNHSRGVLLNALSPPNSNPVTTSSIYEQSHIAAIQDLYGIPMQAIASDDSSWETALSKFGDLKFQGGLQLISLSMKKPVVEKLKKLAIEKGGLSRCSTFDVLCAHIWKARVKSLAIHPNTNICLQFPVDSRSRLQPPLGANFTGNAFALASVSCTAKHLINEPLHCTVERIQVAKDTVTDEYVKLYATALESTDKFFPSMRELTIVTDWTRLPIHALDFGWGKVSSVSVLATPVPETAYLMADLEEGGGVLVRMGIAGELAVDLVNNFNHIAY